jgi:hypothetical protein
LYQNGGVPILSSIDGTKEVDWIRDDCHVVLGVKFLGKNV